MMLTIELGPERERLIPEFAAARRVDLSQLVCQAVEDFLAVEGWKEDSVADWAEASTALAPEVMTDESWDEDDGRNGSC